MSEDFFSNELINRFEQMLEDKNQYYFDTEEFHEIITYYLDVGDLKYARKALDYAEEMHPESIDIQIKELEYLLAIDKLKEAATLIQELKEVSSNDVDFIICIAKFWSQKNFHNKAIQHYEKALEFGEDLDYIYNCLGNEYLSLNEIGQALLHFKKALEVNPDDDYALFSCIECFNEMHLAKQCVNFLNQYIEMRPYSEDAWHQLGLQYITLKNYEKAHRAFDYAVLINPKSISSHTQKALSLEKLGDYEAAINTYKEGLEFDDSSGFTYLKIGKCYEKMDKPFKALKAYRQSLHEDPQLDKSWIAASDLYDKLGNFEEAIYHLNRALELDSSNVELWKKHAYLNIQLIKIEEAADDYLKLTELEPKNFYNWIGLTETLITIGDYNKAIDAANKGLEYFEKAELHYQISNCYYLLGEEKKGNAALMKAKNMDSSLQVEMFKKYPVLEQKNIYPKGKINKKE